MSEQGGKRRFIRFKGASEGHVWVAPLAVETIFPCPSGAPGMTTVETSVARRTVKGTAAEVAERLGITLEGVNDGGEGEAKSPEPSEAKDEPPTPLAVGQRWKGGMGEVEITYIDGRHICYRYTSLEGKGCCWEADFRQTFPTPVSPAPAKDEPAPLAVGQV